MLSADSRRVRWRDGRFECAQCGAVLEVPEDALPAIVIVGIGAKRNSRAVMLRDEEIHRCEMTRDNAERLRVS